MTAPAIEGPWSDPVHVNSSGFDPSLFHEESRHWFLNMIWNHDEPAGARFKHPAFVGIRLQEWDAEAGRLVGPATTIFEGSAHGFVEGPHLFKRRGWYYLTTAEGGTGYDHAVTMARSRRIEGPYELHPNVHLLTSKNTPQAPLQRAGHGQIVETASGEVYHTHLCSRPLPGVRRSPLGRETAILKCEWRDDDWLYLADGGLAPSLDVEGPDAPTKAGRVDYVFSPQAGLPLDFQWLRTPFPQRIWSLSQRPGWLRLIARESIGSWFEQALVARRQQHFAFRAETTLEFAPQTFQQAAGLTLYYNRYKFFALAVSHSQTLGRTITVLGCEGDYPQGRLAFPVSPVAIGDGPIRLAARVEGAALRFQFALADEPWVDIGPTLDASLISDEAGGGEHRSFTGAFIGIFAFDTSGGAIVADFSGFSYEADD